MQFRHVNEADFPAVLEFVRLLWDYNTYEETTVREVYRRILEDPASDLFLIEDASGIHGFCHWNYYDTFWMAGRTCYLSGLYVKEEDRGKGYGKAAIGHLRKLAADAGCKGIILESGLSRTRTHAFYEGQGFDRSCFGFSMIL